MTGTIVGRTLGLRKSQKELCTKNLSSNTMRMIKGLKASVSKYRHGAYITAYI